MIPPNIPIMGEVCYAKKGDVYIGTPKSHRELEIRYSKTGFPHASL